MNMMEPFGGELVTELLLHAGFVLTALAYLVREILWLRVLAILANLCVAYAAYRMVPDPRWIVVAWALAFVLINLVHSIWLVYERHVMRLSEEERRLSDAAFNALDPVSVRRLLRRGSWTTIPEKECVVRQGVHLERLLVIASGEAAVLLGGRIVSRLSAGKFVGEISFLNGEPATATVVAMTPLRCISWKQSELESLFDRRPELLSLFHAAVGRDLAAKIATHNVTLSQV